MAEPDRARAEDIEHAAGLVREMDRPRYYATLFAPEPLRSDLFALYGFAAEIARIPEQVRDPTLGEIRLQWWRDALIAGAGRGTGGESPALRALLPAIRAHLLPTPPFEALIEARGADLYADPPATIAELETQLATTDSALFSLGSAMAGARGADLDAAAHHAGVAYGLARRLSRFAADRARGRSILPADLLVAEGLQPSDVFADSDQAALRRVIGALAGFGRDHLARFRVYRLPRAATPVYLPLAIVEPALRRVERLGPDATTEDSGLSDLATLTRMAFARLRGHS